MRQTARAVTQMYNLALKPAAIEITHFTVLRVLDDHPGLTTGDLACLLVMDQTTVTRTLRLMETAGLLSWRAGLDRRHKRWALTPLGEAKFQAARPLWVGAQADLQRQFGTDAADSLHRLGFALTARLVS